MRERGDGVVYNGEREGGGCACNAEVYRQGDHPRMPAPPPPPLPQARH